MIYKNEAGLELLNFWDVNSQYTPDPMIPLTFVIVAARYADHWVLIYNQHRNRWEIPGGGILPDEMPLDCARREFYEETSQIAGEMSYRGRFLIRLPEGPYEYGMLYQTELDDLYPFTVNEETTQLRLLPCNYTQVDDVDGWQDFMFSQCYDIQIDTETKSA